MPSAHDPRPPIFVSTIYTPQQRQVIRDAMAARKIELDVGMTLLHADITRLVHANRHRVVCQLGRIGVFVDCLSTRNLFHMFDGRRTHDCRMQILDAYLQILSEPPPQITIH